MILLCVRQDRVRRLQNSMPDMVSCTWIIYRHRGIIEREFRRFHSIWNWRFVRNRLARLEAGMYHRISGMSGRNGFNTFIVDDIANNIR
jgi:hypothetical protein